MAETRGLVRYYGGKAKLAERINALLPRTHVYVEPFFGAGNVLFRREPSPIEVINDADERLVTVYRVMQDRASASQLVRRLQWTPWSRAEFRRAIEILKRERGAGRDGIGDSVTLAWAYLVMQVMGFSGREPTSESDWGVSRSYNLQVKLRNLPRRVLQLARRIKEAVIECRPAIRVLRQYDSPDTLHYLDPPYVMATRRKVGYACEMTDDDHRALVATALECQGAVAISGYRHEIYQPLEDAGWHLTDWQVHAHSAARVRGSGLIGKGAAAHQTRTETLWRNPRCVELCESQKTENNLYVA